MMENNISFPSFHNGVVNSIKFNYTCDKIATCGNDYKINIFSFDKIKKNNDNIIESELINNGHEQSIWDLSFSHPSLGKYLASCGFDNKLIIWKENESNPNIYENIYTYNHQASVNCCKFAPHEYGLIVLCGVSDGSVSLHEYKPNSGSWACQIIEKVHKNGINSIDWAPAIPPINFEDIKDENNYDNNELNPMRFITCGNDNRIHIYKSQNNNIVNFVEEINQDNIKGFTYESIPKSVSFLNYVGYAYLTFAVGFEDGKCLIYKYNSDNNSWKIKAELSLNCPIIKVSWSTCGTYLGISSFNNNEQIRFFKENMDEKWVEVKKM
jgi:protein transport protein SEC13